MSNKSTNTAAVPEAKGALDRFKFEVANELGVPLTDGYNGNRGRIYGKKDDRSPGKTDERRKHGRTVLICPPAAGHAGRMYL